MIHRVLKVVAAALFAGVVGAVQAQADQASSLADEDIVITYQGIEAAGKKPGGRKPVATPAKTKPPATKPKVAPKAPAKPKVASKSAGKPKVGSKAKAPKVTAKPHANQRIPTKMPGKIHEGGQGKHIKGHNSFQPGKSVFYKNQNPQKMVQGVKNGKYKVHGWEKNNGQMYPIVNFRRPIGHAPNQPHVTTTYGKIHYGKKGTHIVPYLGPVG